MTKYFLITLLVFFCAWKALDALERLLAKKRLKKLGEPDGEFVPEKRSKWNSFLHFIFGIPKALIIGLAIFATGAAIVGEL